MNNVDKYRSAHEAFNRRDWTGVIQDFAANAVYVDRARGVTLKGPQEFVSYLKDNWVATFSDAAVTEVDYLDAGDHVIAQFIGTGTNDGARGSMPATGRRIMAPFCEVMRFNAAGQIISGYLYYDQVTLLVQLGQLEPPPTP